ncbi:hypothetical protein [Acinetobacter sp. CFCC 10889]|uniref:hypothetical protein n=1 Tax=Acinetobacter sp. CFCC 10889 TaxID=1775557 RepID=UPI000DCF6F87|nr:hypothetical protein [Acinetobacter sp. CFCC 10889]
MKSNIPKHPCANKYTEFKTEQCNHCLIMANSPELESTESDFLVGDVVVSTCDDVEPYLFTVIAIERNSGEELVHCRMFGYLIGFSCMLAINEIRTATVAELHANRRLTEAEHALAEVS